MAERGRLAGAALLALALAGIAGCGEERAGPGLTGRVSHVRDGDTLVLGKQPIRLKGIAAPERRDPLGQEAGATLRRLVGSASLRCEPDGTRNHDRIVAVCYLDGRDVGALMVREGMARDCPRYSGGRYARDEAAARAKGAVIGKRYRLPGYCAGR